FQPFYDWGKSRGKPLAVFETGVLEDTKTPDPQRKAQWFKDAATTIKNWPQMKAVIYFNAWGWYFDSSKPATDAYKAWGADPHFNPRTAPPSDATKPIVNVTAPANGATVSGMVSATATATDNVGVAQVEFLVNGVVRATDVAAPYDFSWDTTGLADGSATLSARATDTAGNVGSSATLAVTVDNADKTAPSVSLTSPANGATVSGSISLTAEAHDNVAVSRIDFVVDGAIVASDDAAPYSVSWSTTDVANGPATLTARAFDAAGNVGSSAATVTVANGDNTAPSAVITSPTAGASLSGLVTVSANADDNVAVAHVELLVDGVVRANDAAAPYSFQLDTTGLSNGSRTLIVRALDAAGNAGASDPVVVTIANGDTIRPSVKLTKPIDGAIVVRGQAVQLEATASDNDAVARVEFWVNGWLRCSIQVAPYTCTWIVRNKVGTWDTVRATAYDAAGNSRSSIVHVTTK
ncbi:MAG: Ig-like domain-containing protein, partial [Gaiellaceae bacterium]